MAKKARRFRSGFVTGIVTTLGTIAAGLFTYKKKVLDPAEAEAKRIEHNRIRANRKSHSAHQG
ncbi:DUF3042 family protein [Lactobacillus psittaci]|uniref:DUF3042 domain-containing protein n=1 Tax=Lactobacillus psittaci DSM 15354 TaxID=1122152 RepID=A0A0R1S9U9_9LACO|nr:DUF3042 family protein [Lactobacillus psittaci]KRL63410.1 hypothetical protein FC23_GL000650 [Lactobacillus psittaci DSM 15354]